MDENYIKQERIETFLKGRGGGWLYMSATMVDRRRKFYLSDGLKRPKYVGSYKFLTKYFDQYFQFLSQLLLHTIKA